MPSCHKGLQELLVFRVFLSLVLLVKILFLNWLVVATLILLQVDLVLLVVLVLALRLLLDILSLMNYVSLLPTLAGFVLLLPEHRPVGIFLSRALPRTGHNKSSFSLEVANPREANSQDRLHPQGVVDATAVEQDLRLLIVGQSSTSQHLARQLLVRYHHVLVLSL